MTALHDAAAEAIVAACCIDNIEAALLAHARLDAADFAHPGFAMLFDCSIDLPSDPPDHLADPAGPMLHELRAQAAAQRCNILLEDVLEMMALRPVMSDTAGSYAGRVHAAARARKVAVAVEDARLDLAEGVVDVDEVIGELRRLLEAA